MHRALNISNIGQGAITIIVTNRGGQSNRKKGHSRLFNLIRISLMGSPSGLKVKIKVALKRLENLEAKTT